MNQGSMKMGSPFAAAVMAALLLAFPPFTHAADQCIAPDPVQHALDSALHVPNCLQVEYSHYPPTSGRHYPIWADFQSFPLVLSPGYYLHDEEHGAVVFLVNCRLSGDCAGDRARLKAIADAYPQDPLCDNTVRHRIVIAGDTVMDTRFAAVAWGWSLKSDCLDSAAFAGFLSAHYGNGPEETCSRGTDFSGSGWCVAPLGLHGIRDGGSDHDQSGPRGPNTLWSGTLERSGRLQVEVMALDGRRLATYDLGRMGPGSATAVWDAEGFRREHPGAGVVVCRVSWTDAGVARMLGEGLAFP